MSFIVAGLRCTSLTARPYSRSRERIGPTIRFDGQVALVTGAGRGLGRAYALLLAERGAQVVVHDAGMARDGSAADPSVARAVADEITALGGTAVACPEDLADRAGCEAAVTRALDRYGRLDALVHNAGLVVFGSIEDTTPADWERMTRVHVDAAFWLCRAAWPAMRARRYGRIVLTVSGVAMSPERAMDDLAAYSAGKAAQFGLMNSLAVEGAPHGIRVNAVSPVASTRMTRHPTPDRTPEQVAPAVAFLASDRCDRSGLVVRAAGGRFSTGSYVYGQEIDLGPAPAPENVAQHLG
jgi:NAD(P)-dependent dehydrogenase (short-subunit alcohol dehydrogenase family)